MIDKLHFQLESLKRSYTRLKEALERDPHRDSIVLDAVIQRFEFTIENAWKTIKLLLKYNGIECTNPRECVAQAYKIDWIDDEKVYLELLRCRNLTSHTYKQELAWEVYDTVLKDHIVFGVLIETLNNQLSQLESETDDNNRSQI